MSVSFLDMFPAIQQPMVEIGQIGWVKYINQTVWIFAIVETAHLLFLTVLGGAAFVLNLRLLDAILRDVPAAVVEKAVRPWLNAGIIGTLLTGIFMSIATAVTLLPNHAFFVKILAFVAAILLSSAQSRQIRSGSNALTGESKLLAGIAFGLWIGALLLFAGTRGLASGSVLVALAGFGLFGAFVARYRRAYLIGLAVIVLAGIALALGGNAGGTLGSLAPLLAALVLVVAIGRLEVRGSAFQVFSPGRICAFSTALAWVTVAAAGRWIGFS